MGLRGRSCDALPPKDTGKLKQLLAIDIAESSRNPGRNVLPSFVHRSLSYARNTMSQNLIVGNEHPQPSSENTAIGVTYIPSSENSTLRRVMEEAESQVILRALQHTGWNRKRAAAILKISYRGLLYKVRRHNITPGGGIGIRSAVPAQGTKIE